MWDFVESLKRLVLLNPKWRATCENLDPTVWQWQWHWLWSLILKGCAWGASMASCACVNPWKQASAALLSVHKFSPCKSQFWFIALLNQILVRTSLSASAEAISCKTSNHPQTAVQCAHEVRPYTFVLHFLIVPTLPLPCCSSSRAAFKASSSLAFAPVPSNGVVLGQSRTYWQSDNEALNARLLGLSFNPGAKGSTFGKIECLLQLWHGVSQASQAIAHNAHSWVSSYCCPSPAGPIERCSDPGTPQFWQHSKGPFCIGWGSDP